MNLSKVNRWACVIMGLFFSLAAHGQEGTGDAEQACRNPPAISMHGTWMGCIGSKECITHDLGAIREAGGRRVLCRAVASEGGLPEYVDNSTLPSFPPITSQSSTGACSIFAAFYYQMTHMAGLANGYNNKSGKSTVFAPNWSMNFGVGGIGGYDLARKNGAASWEDIPFTPDPTVWNTNPDVWARALNYRVDQNGSIGNVNTEHGFLYMKELLSKGYVLYFDTWIGSFLFKKAGDDPSTDKDDAFVGKNVVYGLDGYAAGHAFTIVGYNDNMWVDINGNNQVDPGEKGAIKVANAWGEGYEDKGFTYIAYDALKEKSTVVGVPSKRRFGSAFTYNTAYWVTFKANYYPRLLAKITLNTSKRNQIRVQLGYSPSARNTPQYIWDSYLMNKQGGALGFDGTEKASDGSFVFDFTELIAKHSLEGLDNGRWYVIVTDSTADGNPVVLKDFTLIDNITRRSMKVSNAFPMSIDGGTSNAWVDYSLRMPLDKEAPTVPGALTVKSAFANSVTLTWAESKDNIAIKQYAVFRNGAELTKTEKTSMTETNLPLGKSYVYTVKAVDTSNNSSAASNAVFVKVSNSAAFDTTATYKLVNKKSGKVLAAALGTILPGVPLVQYHYSRQGSQHWKLVDAGDGSHTIYTLPGKMLAQVDDASLNNGAHVRLWSDTGSDGTKWIMIPVGTSYAIANKNSSKVLSVIGSSTAESAQMEQTTFANEDSQLWNIETVSMLTTPPPAPKPTSTSTPKPTPAK